MSAGGRLGALGELEVWFLTGSQNLYGDAILEQVARNSSELVAALNGSSSIPVRIVHQPALIEADGIRHQMLAANSSDRCVGVDRVDAHVFPVEDVDRRPFGIAEAVAASPHAVQPRSALGGRSTWTS